LRDQGFGNSADDFIHIGVPQAGRYSLCGTVQAP
jgi:hypothetical protein